MPSKKPLVIKPAQLREAFKIDLGASWQHARALHPNHTPYAFVLYGVEDIPRLSPHVLTEESLTQAAERYLKDGHYETLAEARKGLRYSVADSPHFAETEAESPTVDAMFEQYAHMLDETAGYALLAKAAMEAFEQLDEKGIFGRGKKRERLLLMINTEDADKDWSRVSAKRLNPSAAFRRYAADTRVEGVFASCNELAISPDGRLLFAAESRELDARKEKWLHEIVAYDIRGMRLERRWSFSLADDSVRDLALAADGTLVALQANYAGAKPKTLLTRFGIEDKAQFQAVELQGEPKLFAVSHDGSRIAVIMYDKKIHFVDANFRICHTLRLKSQPHGLHFLKSGELLAATSEGIIRIDRNFKAKSTKYTGDAFDISLDADETLLAVSRWFCVTGNDQERNEQFGFKILKWPGMQCVRSIQMPGHQLVRAALSPDGCLVAFGGHEVGKHRDFCAVHDVATGVEVARRKSDYAASLIFFSDNKMVAMTSNGFTKLAPIVLWAIPNPKA